MWAATAIPTPPARPRSTEAGHRRLRHPGHLVGAASGAGRQDVEADRRRVGRGPARRGRAPDAGRRGLSLHVR
jgi:hypothetical protein